MIINRKMMEAYRSRPEKVREILQTAKNQSTLDRTTLGILIEKAGIQAEYRAIRKMVPPLVLATMGTTLIYTLGPAYGYGFILTTGLTFNSFCSPDYFGDSHFEYKRARESALANMESRNRYVSP